MNKWCINVSFATRIIGAFTMSLSILTINVLVSEFFSRDNDEDFFDSCKVWAMLGINWIQLLRNVQLEERAKIAMICVVVYASLFLVTSIYLALASIMRKYRYAIPWMYLQMISIMDQAAALSIYLRIYSQHDTLYRYVYIPLSTVYMILSMYIWIVVQAARRKWSEEDVDYEERTMDLPTISSNDRKTPSYLSQMTFK